MDGTFSEGKHKRGERYWYFYSVWTCPLCGREEVYKERQYTQRPEKWEDRHEYHEAWDYCGW